MYRELREINDQSHAFSWGMLASKHWKAGQKIRECIYLYSICMYSIWYLCWETGHEIEQRKGFCLGCKLHKKRIQQLILVEDLGKTQGP